MTNEEKIIMAKELSQNRLNPKLVISIDGQIIQGEGMKDIVQLEALLYVLKDQDLRELFITHNKELIYELRTLLAEPQ